MNLDARQDRLTCSYRAGTNTICIVSVDSLNKSLFDPQPSAGQSVNIRVKVGSAVVMMSLGVVQLKRLFPTRLDVQGTKEPVPSRCQCKRAYP